MEKTKEELLKDFKDMIYASWTYKKLTGEEKARFNWALDYAMNLNILTNDNSKNWIMLSILYNTFLEGVGYEPIGWREETNENFID